MKYISSIYFYKVICLVLTFFSITAFSLSLICYNYYSQITLKSYNLEIQIKSDKKIRITDDSWKYKTELK